MSVANVAHHRKQLEKFDVLPGIHCLLLHDENGSGDACVIVKPRVGKFCCRVSYPRRVKGATDWVKPRVVHIADLYAADILRGDLKDIFAFTNAHGPCPYLPT